MQLNFAKAASFGGSPPASAAAHKLLGATKVRKREKSSAVCDLKRRDTENIHMYVHIHAYAHTYIHIHTMYTYMHTHIHTYIYIHVHICMYVRTCLCTHTHANTHTHTHTHTHKTKVCNLKKRGGALSVTWCEKAFFDPQRPSRTLPLRLTLNDPPPPYPPPHTQIEVTVRRGTQMD